MSTDPELRPASVDRLGQLERSTGHLADQLEHLTTALTELAELREQTEKTHTQAELAVVTSLDATNEVAHVGPQVRELRAMSVTKAEFRHRAVLTAIWGLVGILVLSYTVVTGQQVFSKYCQFPGYLTQEQANVCNMIFIGDREYVPGVQTTNKVPEVPPTEGVNTDG
jgi:hypothetical protein